MYLGPRPAFVGGPRRIKRRATYEEVRRFRNSREFRTWWEEEEGRNWRINSRHPHMRGTVEYWRCAFLQGRRYTCLARLRITIAYDDRFVIVSRSRDHPHNHQAVRLPDDPNIVRAPTVMEAFPVRHAIVVNISKTGAASFGGGPSTSGTPSTNGGGQTSVLVKSSPSSGTTSVYATATKAAPTTPPAPAAQNSVIIKPSPTSGPPSVFATGTPPTTLQQPLMPPSFVTAAASRSTSQQPGAAQQQPSASTPPDTKKK